MKDDPRHAERLLSLEIKVDQLTKQVAGHEDAINRVGQFVASVGDAATEAHKLGDDPE